MSFVATRMDLEIFILRKINQKERVKYRMLSLICRILKNDTNELICQTERDSQAREQTCGVQRGKRVEVQMSLRLTCTRY